MKAIDLINILSGNNDFEVVFRLNEPNETPYNFTDVKLDGTEIDYSDRTIVLFLEKRCRND